MTYASEQAALSRAPVTLVTITLDTCSRTFGTLPCAASGAPCYNTLATCKYKAAYLATTREFKFCTAEAPVPLPGQMVRPYLSDERYLSQEILMNEALVLNQRCTLTMIDEPDTDIGIDPYRVSPSLREASSGNEATTAAGTFWRNLLARHRNYKNRPITIKRGFVADGFTEADYQTAFRGVLENIEIASNGSVKIESVGLLKLTDVDYPKKTDGRLFAALTSGATTIVLEAWSGVDTYAVTPSTQYDASGYLRIGDEIIYYASVSFNSTTGYTTFSGVVRGLFQDDGWSAAAAHDAGDAVDQVAYMQGNPIDLMQSLLNKAGIANADINTAGFADVKGTWFTGVIFRGVLWEPIKIKRLLLELREQTATLLWQGDDQKIHIDAIMKRVTGATHTVTDDANIVLRSNAVQDQQSQRVTRAALYYDIKAGTKGDETSHFRLGAVAVDKDAEDEFQEVKERAPIYSRWIRSFLTGNDYPRIVASRIVRRFRNGSLVATFESELKDEYATGEIIELVTSQLLGENGRPSARLFLITRKEQVSPGKFRYKAIDVPSAGRYLIIAPSGHPDYMAATDVEREYGYISSSAGKMSNGDDGYLIG